MKAIIAGILIILAIAFAVTLFKNTNVGGRMRPCTLRYILTLLVGILEWCIAFGFTFYLLTFYFDLRQSKGVHRGELRPENLSRRRTFWYLQRRGGRRY